MTNLNIARIRELIFSDSALTLQLYAITDKAAFITAAIDIASANRIALAEIEIAAAINEGSRQWIERWI
jgi:hypothetical protein